ncbi:MAG TPA: 4-alpha-glucanotransferase [Reyranellaceae bacterium]|nr:4-alpha-glucanotransferase [Reyranellaceae bacterium]
MSDDAVRAQARRAGLAIDWVDSADQPQRVSVESLRLILEALDAGPLPVPTMLTATAGAPIVLPQAGSGRAQLVHEDGRREDVAVADGRLPPIRQPGYYKLEFAARPLDLAIAPPRCLTARDLAPGSKPWGLAVQLYGLRRPGDGGIGDTTALQTLAVAAAGQGADAMALSPTHALFPDDPGRSGPYSPSSRLFLNPLLADPAAVLGRDRVRAAGELASSDGLIDWATAGAAKYAQLRRLFDAFDPADADFQRFVREGGQALAEHARFEAERSGAPPQYHQFLQWIADGAFAAAQETARSAGMRIGVISDLAVGLDRSGSEVASHPSHYLKGLSIGAPPDVFNPRGQDWGLTSFSPRALLSNGFAPFLATLRAALRHAGGVRIDHAMGLMRLWLVPEGASSADGAYLAYPLDDLLRLLALESHRHNSIIIGEDLGTVPPEFRRRCKEAGIAGMDVLWFQREDGRFLAPAEWRAEAVAMTTTHDLPTVAGWWRGADLELRRGLGTLGEKDEAERSGERQALWQAFGEASLVERPAPAPAETEPVVDAALAFIAEAPDQLLIAPLEDILGLEDQPNLPGTIDEHPNWRRRSAVDADALLTQPAAQRRLRILARHRT